MFDSQSRRPFEIIALAEQAWQANDSAYAEKLFEQGVSAYKQEEPDGLDFALGRYGAFLLAQGRSDDAAHILKQAVERRTDIPAIWSDYIHIIVDRRDFLERLKALKLLNPPRLKKRGVRHIDLTR